MKKTPALLLVAMALCGFLAVASANPDAKPQQKRSKPMCRPPRKRGPAGHVQALWIGVDVPKNASGRYNGTVTIAAHGVPSMTVKVALEVKGEVLSDRGDANAASS